MRTLAGLIPAAGRGERAYPYTKAIPKCMLEIDGTPNLLKTIYIMRDDLGIKDIFIVIGYLGEFIQNYFGDGHSYGVNITYIQNNALEKGLAYSIFLARKYISDYFCVMLADEYYMNSNHCELLLFPYRESLSTCAVMHVDDRELIKRNYSVETEKNRITRLIEKPSIIKNDILGCGTFILSPVIFQFLEQAFVQANMEYVEFITFLDDLCRQGQKVLYFNLKGTYVNINDRDSLQFAKYHARNKTFDSRTTTLLIYSEGDEEDIPFAIKRYRELACITHIFVIIPYKNTIEEIVTNSGVSVIKCPPNVKLYGEKIKFGIENAPGDILILAEADYSFPSRDVLKLLDYLREADMVVGTRTTRQLIEQGSEMRGIVRAANIFLAKLLEILWWNLEPRFTDVGCTFRAIWKSSFRNVRRHLSSKGPEFSAEMMIEVLHARDRVIEIPVNYFNRSQSMYRKYQNLTTFFRIFFLICRKRFLHFLRK